MKTLRHYLMESVRTYNYTIKILGDVENKNLLNMFIHNLSKFDPVKISDPKTTVIQKNPYGFPLEETNQSVIIIQAEFKYPATEPMIVQIAQQSGLRNMIRAVTKDYNDSINAENDKYANQVQDEEKKALLDTPELEDNGKQASKDYANQYLDKVIPKESSIDIPYNAKKTPTIKNTSKDGIQTKSPFSSVKIPERPAIGAHK